MLLMQKQMNANKEVWTKIGILFCLYFKNRFSVVRHCVFETDFFTYICRIMIISRKCKAGCIHTSSFKTSNGFKLLPLPLFSTKRYLSGYKIAFFFSVQAKPYVRKFKAANNFSFFKGHLSGKSTIWWVIKSIKDVSCVLKDNCI